jgi:hypothetical protein
MPEDMQIIDGKFYTKPPEPVEIPRETVEGWLSQVQSDKATAEANLAQAQDSRESTIASIDATIAKFEADITACDDKAADIQGWLDLVPE